MIEVNGVTLPDIPSEVLEQYPYVVIYHLVAGGVSSYGACCSKEGWTAATENDITLLFPINQLPYLLVLTDAWETDTETNTIPLGNITETITNELCWANHDVLTATSTSVIETESAFNQVATAYTDEVYFPSSVSHPSEYSIPHDDVVFLADQTRRLTGATGSMGFQDIKDGLESVTQTTLSELAVTANGTYTAGDGEGYNKVTVNVPAEAGDGLNFVSNATGRIPDYDHGYATSTLTLEDMFESTAVGAVS